LRLRKKRRQRRQQWWLRLRLQQQSTKNQNGGGGDNAAMVLRYLSKLFQSHLRRYPFRKKKMQKKSFFIYSTTFKKNESGQDFQRVQIWRNDRSQKQKKSFCVFV
jgi:hypothetical protein